MALNEEEAAALRSYLHLQTYDRGSLRLLAAATLWMDGGLRLAESLALTPGQVDWERGYVRVKQGKGDADRVVPVAPEVIAVLARLNASERTAVDAPMLGRLPRRTAEWQIKEAGRGAHIVKDVTPHVLRHTFATLMMRRGFSLYDVKALLGHRSVVTTQVYLHVDPVELAARVQGRDEEQRVRDLAAKVAALPEGLRGLIDRLLEGRVSP